MEWKRYRGGKIRIDEENIPVCHTALEKKKKEVKKENGGGETEARKVNI